MKVAIALGAIAAAVGCGTTVETGGGGNGGTTGSGGNGGGNSPCPATEPTMSGTIPCSTVAPGFRCTYGSDVRPDCRDEWICAAGLWTTTKNVCLPPVDGACGTAAPANGTMCDAFNGSVCTYGNEICVCSVCFGPCTMNALWSCAPAPTGSGCPAVVPNDGSACDAPGADCTYGFPCSAAGAHVTCTGGLWTWDNNIACPL